MGDGGNRKVSFLKVFCDMFRLIGCWFWAIAFVSFLAVIFVVQKYSIVIVPDKLPKTLIDIIPEIMGFLIAGLAIIMGFNEGALKRLSKPANDGEIPLLVIVASFSVCLLILLTSLILSIAFVNTNFVCEGCHKLLNAFVLYGAIISIESVIHVIFHLFATGTFLVYDKKVDK